jgi:hypothetical protein
MYQPRGLDLVTVAADAPDARAAVQRELEREHATSRNWLSASGAAFDPEWKPGIPYTAVIAPDGRMVYRKLGVVDMLELRRTILANFEWEYEGFSKYWTP